MKQDISAARRPSVSFGSKGFRRLRKSFKRLADLAKLLNRGACSVHFSRGLLAFPKVTDDLRHDHGACRTNRYSDCGEDHRMRLGSRVQCLTVLLQLFNANFDVHSGALNPSLAPYVTVFGQRAEVLVA